MAVTVEKAINFKPSGDQYAFPVANGETIYKGTLAVIDDDGYLRNLSSTYAPQAKLVVYVADGSANTGGPAATTAAGSISGSLEEGSADAGDKTVRRCYVNGIFKATFTSITQAMVGKTMYATDNFTLDETQNSGVKVGTLITYISATSGWVELNKFYQQDGTIFYKQAITRSSGGGGLFNILNPAAATIVVERLAVDITVASSAALTFDAGIAATGTTSDVLIDGQATSVVGLFDSITDAGTNGGATVKATSAQYITGTLSGASGALLAGTVGLWYRVWE
jgi:hypothetical protein